MDALLQMEALVRVVESGSITAAADQLDVAKSAISRRLSELERRLGSRLLVRTTRRVRLTETGRQFYERAARILDEVADAESEVSGASAEATGRIRFAAPLSFGLLHLPQLIVAFQQECPGVEFDLDFNDRRVDLVGEGFDMALRIARLEDSTLVARKLTNIRHVVCASPAYWDQHGRPASPADLAGHRLLEYANASATAWNFRHPDGKRGRVQIPSRLRANNGQFLRELAIAGLGVVQQPTFIVYSAIEAGDLQPVLLEYEWNTLSAYAVYPPGRHLPLRVRRFADFLADRFSAMPYWDHCLASAS